MSDIFHCGDDVYITSRVFVKYENFGKIEPIINFAKKSKKILSKMLIVPKDQIIVFDLLEDYIDGYFNFVNQGIYIDPRQSTIYRLARTLCHEAVHAEQYFLGKMSFKIDEHDTNKCFMKFNDELFLYRNSNSNENNDFWPWEIEAYKREDELAKILLTDLEVEEDEETSSFEARLD